MTLLKQELFQNQNIIYFISKFKMENCKLADAIKIKKDEANASPNLQRTNYEELGSWGSV
ncbi:MAG TPA: hypothetical protein DDX39_04440 [Bacteroidales bacterium]|nr:MAG: hypothetical protein A2W98_10560 [Bacteroidetes bacterium GWF2_33_38]OFY73229.1 MAG: hypothetical protein A2265_02120 [Bacteroidetes bacterium RIFOXYA12_FULL_33_9]HBF87872.1 hypothetical protein [Bacteroidales bacterium]